MRFITRILITAAALWAAVYFVDGIHFTGGYPSLLGVALIFGLLNAILRPILVLLSFPLLILTLGLFTLVLNAGMLMLTSAVSQRFGLGLVVDGFGPAFWGAIVVSIASMVLSIFIPDRKRKRDE